MSRSASQVPVSERRSEPLRLVTAASLFDGHDAAINMIRRLLQQAGCEVVHLGHNRSVAEIVDAALQEDADAIACSSYQGGHNEYFRYMVDMLRERGAEHIRVVVGGGGTISPQEVAALEAYGVEKIYTPADGMRLGLVGMIDDVVTRIHAWPRPAFEPRTVSADNPDQVARTITLLEQASDEPERIQALRAGWRKIARSVPVVGITGTGGAGKSSLTDELLNRLRRSFPEKKIAVLAVDPTRRRTGGALLGDRIRLNSLSGGGIFMRSLATRRQNLATSAVLEDSVMLLKAAAFDLVLVETAGIGQSDTEIVDLVDLSLYVMTSDYGAASQLEKIDMIDYADLIVLNKFEKRGAEDALRDVRKQYRRNRNEFGLKDEDLPVFPTVASQFNDAGVNTLFHSLCQRLASLDSDAHWQAPQLPSGSVRQSAIVPVERQRYLAEIADGGRAANARAETLAAAAGRAQALYITLLELGDAECKPLAAPEPAHPDPVIAKVRGRYAQVLGELGDEALSLLRSYAGRVQGYTDEQYGYKVRDKTLTGDNYTVTLAGERVPKIAVPSYTSWAEQLRFLMRENFPGAYPFTGGVYPYRREHEDPIRMFAGEGEPERTNRRFHILARGHSATRLSTAFDSVTLYGEDPDPRPDIYGRVGNSGVSIATLDDMKKLYSGFDLCAPTTSVSMTINGPAPMILAMFLNTAIDQQVEKHLRKTGGWEALADKLAANGGPDYCGDLPRGHDGSGLGLLGISGDQVVDAETYALISADTLRRVRGTVQADILKEDQAQNTCIFSTEFAMRMMGDVQAWFSANGVRNFYSVSISGYHIAEAGANPISQLAFTLSNGFTIVEYYLSRGMHIDKFAPNLSFFFSNGMDAEYAVIGRVARRIWARAMRERYGANERSQKLKYHIQTSGRSLHAQEMDFNDIRTTLQALYALYDNCNSLHTNAFDEALTTPTEESVRRAVAIQLIINRELGQNRNQNTLQGSFLIEELTDLVEEAVYREFERLTERGGVLGAMETQYQRGKIQDESLHYESLKHDGSLPIIGVNTFLAENANEKETLQAELIRSSDEEKNRQVAATRAFNLRNEVRGKNALATLADLAARGENLFPGLMEAVKCCSLGAISHTLYSVGGRYRRNL